MSPETNRLVLRSSWLIAAALWATSLWMWFDIRDAAAPPAQSPPVALAESAADTAVDGKPEPVFVPERSRAPARADEPAPAKAKALCGLEPADGRVMSDAEIEAAFEEQHRQAHARTAAALAQRDDAAAHTLRALLEVQRGMQAGALDCLAGADCSARLQAAVLSAYQRAPQAVDALLQAAQAANDPLMLQTALLVCDAQRGVAKGCAGLSPRRLVQLDADNAAAWLDLAAREPAAADEALYRASIATRWDSYTGRALAQADEALPTDLSILQRAAIAVDVTATVHAFAFGPLFQASRLCSEAAVRDANRAQVCERVSRTMVERGRDMLEVGIGLGIASRLPALNETLRDARERNRARSALMASQPAFDPAAGCNALQQQLQVLREVQRSGEVAYWQRAVERSGLSVAELARRSESRTATVGERGASAPAMR